MQQTIIFACLLAIAFAANPSEQDVDAFLAGSPTKVTALDQAVEKIQQLEAVNQNLMNQMAHMKKQMAQGNTQAELDGFLFGGRKLTVESAQTAYPDYYTYTTAAPDSGDDATTTKAPANNGGAVAGGVIAGVVVVGFAAWVCYRKKDELPVFP